MINIKDAIFALDSLIISIRDDVAYDQEGNEVTYDKSAAESKLAELQAAEQVEIEAAEQARQSAIAKLTAIGLTADEIAALGVK